MEHDFLFTGYTKLSAFVIRPTEGVTAQKVSANCYALSVNCTECVVTQSIPNVPIPRGIGNEFAIVEFRNFYHFQKRKTISYYEYVTTAV